MGSYTPLFASLVNSTIWREDDKTRILWITMLAIKDRDNLVEASIPGLASLANMSIPECEKALQSLMSPDPYSRTKENEGRRVTEVDGGWFIINGNKYNQRARDRAAYFREYRSTNTTPQRTLANPLSSSSSASLTKEGEKKDSLPIVSKKTPEEIHSLKLQEQSFGKFCTHCGKSPNEGKVIWREKLPFCAQYHYEIWRDNKPK